MRIKARFKVLNLTAALRFSRWVERTTASYNERHPKDPIDMEVFRANIKEAQEELAETKAFIAGV